jgi:hypothetical protein
VEAGGEAAEGRELIGQLLRDDARVRRRGLRVTPLVITPPLAVAEEARLDAAERVAAVLEVALHVLDACVGEHAPVGRAAELPSLA